MKTRGFLGNEWDIDCMGCAISDQSMLVPGGIIQKTKHFCVHQDPLIPLQEFLVIASKRHIQSISEMHASEYEELSRLIIVTHRAIKEVTTTEYLTLIQEERSVHFHLWFFPWTWEIIERYGQPSLTKIREIMTAYRKQPVTKTEWAELQKSIEKIKTLTSNLTHLH